MFFEKMLAEIYAIPLSLRKIANGVSRPMWVTNASRVMADVILISGTITTVTTVSTVSNITNLGGNDAKQTLLYDTSRINWAESVRRRIH